MAEDTSLELSLWAELPIKYSHLLDEIRHWENVKICEWNELLWLKDFNQQQFKSKELNSIPYIQLYYVKNGLMFLKNKSVPEKKIKSSLYWSSLSKYFSLEIEKSTNDILNINEIIDLKLIQSNIEKKSNILKCNFDELEKFILLNPDFRYKNLDWCLVNDEVLIKGCPLLPLQGNTYWIYHSFILPSGYHLEYPMLANCILQEDLLANYFFFLNENECVKFEKIKFIPLSISSFNKTKFLSQ